MAFTVKILSWRFRHLNIVGCLLKRRPTKGGHGHPRTPPSYAPVTAEHLCHEHQETTISSNKTVTNRAFSHDITVAKLVFQNNEMSPVLMNQTKPVGVYFFSYVNAFFCSIEDAGHVSENALYQERPITGTIGIRPDS